MNDLTIRNIDSETVARLTTRAIASGRPVEEEARAILSAALDAPGRSGRDLIEAIRARVAPFGGVVLEIPPRDAIREPPSFDP